MAARIHRNSNHRMQMNFPNNLKQARLEKSKKIKSKVTQLTLADELGITRNMIASYEQGLAEPGLCVLVKMAKYLETDVNSLLSD